jgi:RNA polymerase sigma factor (sigma-70 family)
MSNFTPGGHYWEKPMADDAQLLRRYVETRSEAAFAELVDRHLGLVYHSALRRLDGDTHRAYDVAQGVFILLAQRAASLSHHPSLAGWLHTTTHFKVADLLRAERRRRRRETAVHLMHEILSEPPREADWDRLRPVLDEVLQELKPVDREAVLLRFFEGRAFAEIGERLAVTEQAAHKRVERALNKLRDRLTRRGLTSTTAALATCLGAHATLAAPAGLAAGITSAAVAAPIPTAVLFLSFMSTTKMATTTAVLALGLLAGFTVHEIRASREAEARLHIARLEHDQLAARLRAAEAPVARLKAENAALEQKAAHLRASPTSALSPAQSVFIMEEPDAARQGRALVAQHPELRAALAADLRAQLLQRYGELFARLGLTPAQIDECVRLLSLARSRALGMHVVTLNEERIPGPQLMARFREIVGETGYQQYREVDRAAPASLLTQNLAGSVYFTASPLTKTQAEQFQDLVRGVLSEPTNGKPVSGMWHYFPPAIWDALLSRASAVLDAPQLSALRDLQQQALYLQAQSAASNDYYSKAAPSPAPGK